jgi:hypothetical protein
VHQIIPDRESDRPLFAEMLTSITHLSLAKLVRTLFGLSSEIFSMGDVEEFQTEGYPWSSIASRTHD